MRLLKRINNNAVLCADEAGNRIIALGRGLSQAKQGDVIDLSSIDHTYYDVEPRYIELLRDLPPDCVALATQISDLARGMLTYTLSPNLEIALADHITFAIQRMREHIYVTSPLAVDIRQHYPVEFKIAEYALRLIHRDMKVDLPQSEVSGIALSIINNAYADHHPQDEDQARAKDRLLETITAIVERSMKCKVDREGFGFARFATHVRYLLQRVDVGQPLLTANSDMYTGLSKENPLASHCVDEIAAVIKASYERELTEEEKLYLILHVNRICARSSAFD